MSDAGSSLFSSMQARLAPLKSYVDGLLVGGAASSSSSSSAESRSFIRGILQQSSAAAEAPGQEALRAAAAQRNELLMKLLTSVLGLAVTFAVSYYGIRWLVNVMDPTHSDKQASQKRAEKLMKSIGVDNVKLTEYELCIASNLIDPLTMVTEWKDIGGLDDTIREIRDSVIMPFKHHDKFAKSGLIQPPKGVLLYGPPGCGKTMIAKATAKATGARFINLQISSLVDKWYGESQKRAEAVFSLAHKLQPTIIFIDEIDSFLRSRMSTDHEATSMIKTQFMSFWDGLITDQNCRIMIIGATNRPSDVDAAILRRMPCMFHIGLPDAEQRKRILEIILKNESLDESFGLDELSQQTTGLSGSDLREVCRSAATSRVLMSVDFDESCDEDGAQPYVSRAICKSDFDAALSKFRSTKSISNLAAFQQIAIE